MYRNLIHHFQLHKQCNRISVGIGILLLLSIYLTINLFEKYLNEQKLLLKTRRKISQCPPLLSSSKGYFRVDFTRNFSLNYSLICKSNDKLLIYILSTAKNFERRKIIRETWAKKSVYQQLNDICFIFIVGLSTNTSHNNDIYNEGLLSNDIIQLNIEESYKNVVYKEVGALQWSYIYASNIPYLFKTDDDLIIDTLLLSDTVTFLINNQTDHSLYLQKQISLQPFIHDMYHVDKYTLFKGHDMLTIQTLRRGKFRIHDLAWNSEYLPRYCSGFGFLYSSFIRDRLYRASLCYANEYVPLVGDVFVSGFLAGTASVRCSGWLLKNAQPESDCPIIFHNNPQLLACSTPLHRGKQIYSDFYSAWKIIVQRHSIYSNQSSRDS
ncbi:unnamed protein product [Adineta steineri]|uniref:Hexosyltransferase n=1 Tax=Adineta steineri TaxID=433720 RepID=A0A815IDX2_9BILA|nr:unnamed protein product [Adineta steineri]CAF3531326.1 unnamed protein product [Adineta steineri]